ncbi:MAG: hypothetical protein U1E60_23875 [Reyranellaceae bacterium]
MTQDFRPIFRGFDPTARTASRPQATASEESANALISKDIDRTDRTDRKKRGSFYFGRANVGLTVPLGRDWAEKNGAAQQSIPEEAHDSR